MPTRAIQNAGHQLILCFLAISATSATVSKAISGAPTSECVILRCQCSHVGRPQNQETTSISGAFAASTRIAVPHAVKRLNPARARNNPTNECVRLSKL